MEFNKVWYLY